MLRLDLPEEYAALLLENSRAVIRQALPDLDTLVLTYPAAAEDVLAVRARLIRMLTDANAGYHMVPMLLLQAMGACMRVRGIPSTEVAH